LKAIPTPGKQRKQIMKKVMFAAALAAIGTAFAIESSNIVG